MVLPLMRLSQQCKDFGRSDQNGESRVQELNLPEANYEFAA